MIQWVSVVSLWIGSLQVCDVLLMPTTVFNCTHEYVQFNPIFTLLHLLILAFNPCASNNCSHLCLLSTASAGYTCVCPDGFRKAANNTCISVATTSPPMLATTAPTPTVGCVQACENGGTCIGTTCACASGWTGSYCQTGTKKFAWIANKTLYMHHLFSLPKLPSCVQSLMPEWWDMYGSWCVSVH